MFDALPKLNHLSPANDMPGAAIAPPRGKLKCLAIFCFTAAPFFCAWTIQKILPDPPAEHVEKVALFDRLPVVDTVIVGDSRVGGISESPFKSKGWHFFDMGLSGVSPEDMAMELKYALLHGKIRRVVMGVSFEGMAARYPFDCSRFYGAGPFSDKEIVGFATVAEGPRPAKRSGGMRKLLKGQILPIDQANIKLRWLIARNFGLDIATYLPNGTADYKNIREQIAAGDFDFAKERDPKIYFNREDSEPRYLEKPALAPFEQQLYRKVFATLRDAKIPCVVFETGRSNAYQEMIDAYPELTRLQAQWRSFFQEESRDGVKFLDATATRDCYSEEDFFDAVHFIGATGTRLADRLANELAALETNMPAEQKGP